MLKRMLLAAALATVLTASAPADLTQPNLFIQVTFDDNLPAVIDPSDDPGRFEVTIGGVFVGCAIAAYYEDRWEQVHLLPISTGFTARGRKEDVKVVPMGSLTRYTPKVKIMEVPGTSPTKH
jgi:hypothetical protein